MDSPVNVSVKGDSSSIIMEPDKAEQCSQKSSRSINLQYGFDSLDDSGNEILREEFHISVEEISPIFPRKKISGGFRLTPRLEIPKASHQDIAVKKANDQQLDLTTPHNCVSVNNSVECIQRPCKHRRAVKTQTAEKSRRHLCYEATSVSSPAGKASNSDVGVHPSTAPLSLVLDASSSLEKCKKFCKNIDEIKEKAATEDFPFSSTPEDKFIPVTLSSPTSSVCSRSSCSISSCSSASKLPSPNLSEIKETSRTILSSDGEVDEIECVEAVIDPPELVIRGTCNYELNLSEDDKFVGPPSPGLKISQSSGNAIIAGNALVSSADSIHSNWTVISGISPLPSSDPTHLRHRSISHGYHSAYRGNHHHHHYYNNQHSHHHHHHHRPGSKPLHHHGHRHSSDGSHDRIVLTSTPIHAKSMKETGLKDVSDIRNSQTTNSNMLIPETSRFAISIELKDSIESISETANTGSGTQRKMETTPLHDKQSVCAENTPASKELNSLKRKRHCDEISVVCSDVSEDGKLSEEHSVESSISYYQCDERFKNAGCTPYVRNLTKKEVSHLNHLPVNVSDDIWKSLPARIPHHSTGESLSPEVDTGSPPSKSLINFNYQ